MKRLRECAPGSIVRFPGTSREVEVGKFVDTEEITVDKTVAPLSLLDERVIVLRAPSVVSDNFTTGTRTGRMSCDQPQQPPGNRVFEVFRNVARNILVDPVSKKARFVGTTTEFPLNTGFWTPLELKQMADTYRSLTGLELFPDETNGDADGT